MVVIDIQVISDVVCPVGNLSPPSEAKGEGKRADYICESSGATLVSERCK